MGLPTTIAEPYEHDPLVVLPLPDNLPPSPAEQLALLASTLDDHLSNADGSKIPLAAITGPMRIATRNAQVLQNAARLGAADARVQLDDADVALRTAEYELARVREEMAVCRAYEPMYESMEMPDEESVLEDTEVAAGLPQDDSEARKYAIIIARLEAELAAITSREAKVAELTKERDGLLRSRREIKQKFEKVDVYLSDFAKTSNAMASKVKDVAKIAQQSNSEETKTETSDAKVEHKV